MEIKKCRKGHELTPENTRMSNGYPVCKECKRISNRKQMEYRKSPHGYNNMVRGR